MASKSDKIADTNFTIKWLENVIKERTNTEASIIQFSSTEIGFGRGFLSQIFIVKLSWDARGDSLPDSIALKIPTFKQFLKAFEPMDDKNPMKKSFQEAVTRLPLAKAHKCEVAVYDLFQKNSPSGLKIPKYYFGRNMQNDGQGVLVLEDLSHDALTQIGGLTCGQMMQIAEAIASLHAYSLTYKDWKHDAINSTMRLMSEGFDEKMTIVERIAACVPQLIEWNTEIFDPLAEKLSELVKTPDDVFYVYDLNKTMGLPDVFCNGDLHVNNMMWFKDKDGNATDKLMALLDWQTVSMKS